MNPESSNYNVDATHDDGSCCKCEHMVEEIVDCAGIAGGEAYYDNCEQCVGGTTGFDPCQQDCAGNWGGDTVLDECGICGGDGCAEASDDHSVKSKTSTTPNEELGNEEPNIGD